MRGDYLAANPNQLLRSGKNLIKCNIAQAAEDFTIMSWFKIFRSKLTPTSPTMSRSFP